MSHSLTALGHLGRWLDHDGLDVDQLNGDAIQALLAAHVRAHGQVPTAGLTPLLDSPGVSRRTTRSCCARSRATRASEIYYYLSAAPELLAHAAGLLDDVAQQGQS